MEVNIKIYKKPSSNLILYFAFHFKGRNYLNKLKIFKKSKGIIHTISFEHIRLAISMVRKMRTV